MSYDRGPLVAYEVTWMSGHAEHIQAHSVTVDANPSRVRFHAEIDGRIRLVLDARADDIRTIRDMATESLGGAS